MAKSKVPGRAPTKLTAEVQALICAALKRGATHQTAAELVGITERTVMNWLAWGKRDDKKGMDSPCARFFHAVTRARAEAKADLLVGVMRAAQGADLSETVEVRNGAGDVVSTTIKTRRAAPDTRAALHMLRVLERGYSVSDHVEITGAEGAPIRVGVEALRTLPDDQLAAATHALAALVERPDDDFDDDDDDEDPAIIDAEVDEAEK